MSVVIKNPLHRCPFCREDVRGDQDQVVCYDCLTRHHAECWGENKRCAVYGCAGTSGMRRFVERKKRGRAYPRGVPASALRCPACGNAMHSRVSSTLTYHHCATPACYGSWFGRSEIATLIGSDLLQRGTPVAESRTSPRRCPTCELTLQPQLLPSLVPVEVDICPQCRGVFLDPGERDTLGQRVCAGCGETFVPLDAAEMNENPPYCRPCQFERAELPEVDLDLALRVFAGKS